ncbi:hypothetical protein CKY47_18245 [Saccharothrix yanglingensis]|uniref:Uncharacterized protein n=1 Tax=Saccharothrix yanglingensis TaxID=659496 RepID=A0ABU0X187_9PSEU|nr:hypothetical protein [Saccharothrix yanglingensis]
MLVRTHRRGGPASGREAGFTFLAGEYPADQERCSGVPRPSRGGSSSAAPTAACVAGTTRATRA